MPDVTPVWCCYDCISLYQVSNILWTYWSSACPSFTGCNKISNTLANPSCYWFSPYPGFTGINKTSSHLAYPSYAIYFACQPVPALQPSIHFLCIWPTPALQYMLVVGLSQLYSHQYTFSSSGQPQFCNICWLSAINKFLMIQPAPALQYMLLFSLSQISVVAAQLSFTVGLCAASVSRALISLWILINPMVGM